MRVASALASMRTSRSIFVSFSDRKVLRALSLPPYMSLSAWISPAEGAISTVFRRRSSSMPKVTSCALTSSFATSSARSTAWCSATSRRSSCGCATRSPRRRRSSASRAAAGGAAGGGGASADAAGAGAAPCSGETGRARSALRSSRTSARDSARLPRRSTTSPSSRATCACSFASQGGATIRRSCSAILSPSSPMNRWSSPLSIETRPSAPPS